MPSEAQEKEKMQGTMWKCMGCGMKLGILDPTGEILRIKYKDLYISIQGGRVECMCRRCAQPNVLESDQFAALRRAAVAGVVDAAQADLQQMSTPEVVLHDTS